MKPRAFSVFAPMVIAGIGKQAETVEDRLTSGPKASGRTERIKQGLLTRQCARWVDALYNRVADNWRPLLAVADAIGGSWPEQARAIALTMAKGKLADKCLPPSSVASRYPRRVRTQRWRIRRAERPCFCAAEARPSLERLRKGQGAFSAHAGALARTVWDTAHANPYRRQEYPRLPHRAVQRRLRPLFGA